MATGKKFGEYPEKEVLGSNDELLLKDVTSGTTKKVLASKIATAINADDIDDTSTTKKFTSQADIDKLSGIETGAEVNNISDSDSSSLTGGTDTNLHFHSSDRDRNNHTGTQLMSTISDAGNLATSDSIGTSDIDDDSVTLAKLAGGTADSLQGFNSSGDPSEVLIGANLTLSGGTLSASSGGSGGASVQNVVESVYNSNEFSTTSGTWQAVSSQPSVTITPTNSSNPIVVGFSTSWYTDNNSGQGYAEIGLARDGTVIQHRRTCSIPNNSDGHRAGNLDAWFVDDSHNSTSAITYTLVARVSGAGGQLGIPNNSSASFSKHTRAEEVVSS